MSSDTKWIIGTVIATGVGMIAVMVSVLTFGLASIDGQIDTVNERIDTVNERIDTVDTRIAGMDGRVGALEAHVGEINESLRAIDDKFGTLNTTLLFLTTCLVDLEGPLPVVAATPAALTPDFRNNRPAPQSPPALDPDRLMPPQVRIELPESCRTAHTRALQRAP